jgi:hypothetical protein
MQDDNRAHHHSVVQSSSGLRTSNVTSHHFLGGQPHRSWMVPTQSLQSLFSTEQEYSPSTMTQQAEPVNSNTRRLDGYVQSERALNGATDQTEARVSDTNRTIGTALESIPLHIPEQNPSQHSPNKRPRFDTWAHSAASPVSDGDGPLYNFVSLPVNSPSLENLTMPPPPISTTSPRTANGPGNIPSGYTANQAPTPRRQSSSNNLGTGPPQPGPATPALTPTTSPHPAHQAINTRRTPSMSLLPRLQAARADPSLSQAFSEEWGSRRLLLLEEACRSADWLYLTLHQIFCWRTIDGDGLVQLGFVGRKELELINLEVLLMPNTHLSFMARNFFATFPTTHEDLLHGSSPDAKDALALIHKLLENMSMHWPLLQESCRTRGFPPSPYELYETLGMRSTVLQEVFFTFLFRQIEGGNQWVGRAQQFVSRPLRCGYQSHPLGLGIGVSLMMQASFYDPSYL